MEVNAQRLTCLDELNAALPDVMAIESVRAESLRVLKLLDELEERLV